MVNFYNLVEYELREIVSGVYAVKIQDPYERAMLFLRSQEFYESPIPEIRNKHINIFESMNMYRKWMKKDYFSYTEDWIGFNIPGNIVEKCTKHVLKPSNAHMSTPYDFIMRDIIKQIRKEIGCKKFYLIGVNRFKSNLMDHELAHGLYYIDSNYRKACLELIEESIPKKSYESLKKTLIKMGYTESVIDDEIQAYLSTGIYPQMKKIKDIKEISKIFKKNFKKYKKLNDLNS